MTSNEDALAVLPLAAALASDYRASIAVAERTPVASYEDLLPAFQAPVPETGGDALAVHRRGLLRAGMGRTGSTRDREATVTRGASLSFWRSLAVALCVFAGGCTIDAAEEVCGHDVLDQLTRLVDKSLVIADEHDVTVSGVRPQGDGSVNVDGGVPIRDLNRAMDWNLPDEEATTIAGLVIHEARTIPDQGTAFNFHGFRFQVLRKAKNRITTLRITPLTPTGAQASAQTEPPRSAG